MQLPTIPSGAKPFARKLAWTAHQLFWQQLFPIAAGITSKVVVDSLKRHGLPQTDSTISRMKAPGLIHCGRDRISGRTIEDQKWLADSSFRIDVR
jgi:hypothetical protein